MGLDKVDEINEKTGESGDGTYWEEDPYIPQRDVKEFWEERWNKKNRHSKPESAVVTDVAESMQVSPAFVRFKLSEHGVMETEPDEIEDDIQRRHLKSLFGIDDEEDDDGLISEGVMADKLS